MKFKKIMLITLLLLAVLTIGAVSASDDVASDDLAVSDDGDSIESSVDDADLLSDDGEGGDEYNVDVKEEFDVNNETATVVSLTCPDGAEGRFVVDVYKEGNQRPDYIGNASHDIVQADYNKIINWTVKDLNIQKSGYYSFEIYHLEDGDEKGDDTLIGYYEAEAIDYNEFRIVGEDDEKNCIDESPVFALYCPDGHEATIVNVTVRNSQDKEQTFTKSSSDRDENKFLYWNLADLNMTTLDEYKITVMIDGKKFDSWNVDVHSPVFITDEVSYIDGLLERLSQLVVVKVPSDTEGNIVITFNGSKVFDKSLDEFKCVNETSDDYYWYHPSYGPGPEDTSFKHYEICNGILHDAEEGDYELIASFTVGTTTYSENKTVTLQKADIKTNDGVAIQLLHDDEYEIGSNDYIALISVPDGANGRIVVTRNGETVCDRNISDFNKDEGFIVVCADDLNISDEGSCIINVAYWNGDEKIVENEGNFSFVYDEENEDDADDGVVIRVVEGDEYTFNLDDDLDEVFCIVSVDDTFEGRIVITGLVYDEKIDDDIETLFFNKELSKIENKEADTEFEGFTRYMIKLKDLDDLDDLKYQERIYVAFIDDEDDELDNREYNVNYNEDDNEIEFWEINDDDRGEPINAKFCDANILTNDVIVYISKEDFPDDVDDDFDVFIDDEAPRELSLSKLDGDNEYYFIRVSDLFQGFDEKFETYGFSIFIQFYDTDGEEAYYAEPEDEEEGVSIYTSPYISDEAYLLDIDFVISFWGFEDVDDEFNVTISQEGKENITKTFKISELPNLDDDGGEFYELYLSDLGINETGEYYISVVFTNDGKILVSNNGTLCVGMVNVQSHEHNDKGELETFDSIDMLVFNIKVNENATGFIKLFVNGEQLGGNISFADLRYGTHPPDIGRQILLNNLNIRTSGEYQVRLEVYTENGELIAEKDIQLLVEVGENSVSFEDGEYGCEPFDVIRFSISTPLSTGQCYNIYFNGKKAGNFTANGIVISDEYLDEWFDVKFLKAGNYDVNVTFFDGENETDFNASSFSILKLTLFSDRDVYPFGIGDVLISFNIDDPDKCKEFQAYFLYNWGPQGPEMSEVFPGPYKGKQILELYNGSAITFNPAWFKDHVDHPGYRLDLGTNYIYVEFEYKNGTRLGGIISVEVVEPIDPELTISVTNVTEGEYPVITVTTNKTFTGKVKVYIGNGVYTVNVLNGKGSINVTDISVPGTYVAEAVFEPVDLFNYSTKNTTFTVTEKPLPADPKLTISIADITVGESAVVKITTNNTFSGNVTVQIAGKNYTVAVINGTGSISISGLAAGSYTATAFFAATDNFNASTKATTFKVNKKAEVIKLALKKVKVKRSAKKLVLKAKLKIDGKAVKGRVIKFKFNKKTYKAKTNKKGVAKVKIGKKVLRKLKVGKKVKIKAKYGSKTVKRTVKVKK